jgi:hypothetical protein
MLSGSPGFFSVFSGIIKTLFLTNSLKVLVYGFRFLIAPMASQIAQPIFHPTPRTSPGNGHGKLKFDRHDKSPKATSLFKILLSPCNNSMDMESPE